MVISQFYPFIGGAERQAQLLAKKLMEEGFDVSIITGWWDLNTARKEVINGINVFRNFCGPFKEKKNRLMRMLKGFIYMISLAIYLLIHRREYDLIHVYQALYPAFVSLLIGSRILKKPVVVKSSSSGMTGDIIWMKQFFFGRIMLAYILKKMDHLVAVSRVTGKEFLETGCLKSKIIYIPNGVEIPKIRENCIPEKNALTVARLSREKGIDVLLHAWQRLVDEEKGWRLTILGDGPLSRVLRNLSSSLDIEEWVKFNGVVNDVSFYYKKAKIFILPSRTEGMSNSLLEAMSYGISCIATNVGGNVEILGGEEGEKVPFGGYLILKNGLLVNSDDPDGLYQAILYLIRHPEERKILGIRGRKFVEEKFSIDVIVERYINLYKEILNRKT